MWQERPAWHSHSSTHDSEDNCSLDVETKASPGQEGGSGRPRDKLRLSFLGGCAMTEYSSRRSLSTNPGGDKGAREEAPAPGKPLRVSTLF